MPTTRTSTSPAAALKVSAQLTAVEAIDDASPISSGAEHLPEELLMEVDPLELFPDLMDETEQDDSEESSSTNAGGTDADVSDDHEPGSIYLTETETEAESQGTLNRAFEDDPPPSMEDDSSEDQDHDNDQAPADQEFVIEGNAEVAEVPSDDEPVFVGRVIRRATPTQLLTIRGGSPHTPAGPIRLTARKAIAATCLSRYLQQPRPAFLGRTRTRPLDGSCPGVYDVYRTGDLTFLAQFRFTLPCGDLNVQEFDAYNGQ